MKKANTRRREEQIRRGEKMMRRMLGAEFTAELRRAWRALEPEFERYVVGFLAGEIWARPRLSLKVRSLVTVAALGALGKKEGLALNIRMALNNGASREEVLETLLQLAPYAGFPTAWEALVVAGQVFGQMSKGRTAASKAELEGPVADLQKMVLLTNHRA